MTPQDAEFQLEEKTILNGTCDHDIPYIDVQGCTNVVKPCSYMDVSH